MSGFIYTLSFNEMCQRNVDTFHKKHVTKNAKLGEDQSFSQQKIQSMNLTF